MATDPVVANALLDLRRAATSLGLPWALIGGQALAARGVPRTTEDADALVPESSLRALAQALTDDFEWTPLRDDASGDYVQADGVEVLFMDDPVLFDIGRERAMVALESPMGLVVELLAAQHPIEVEMIEGATTLEHHDVSVPVAPLGGILLVKTKADRTKDVAAIEQTAEHLPRAEINEAVEWAEERDPENARDLRAIVDAVRVRRTPKGREHYSRRRK